VGLFGGGEERDVRNEVGGRGRVLKRGQGKWKGRCGDGGGEWSEGGGCGGDGGGRERDTVWGNGVGGKGSGEG